MAKGINTSAPDPVYPKEKGEDYNLLGGINTKVSTYINNPAEFRDISNLNFINSGALTKRPGTTLFAGTTLIQGSINTLYEFQKLNGASYLIMTGDFAGNGSLYTIGATTVRNIVSFSSLENSSTIAGTIFSFTSFVDRAFGADGNVFLRMGVFATLVLSSYNYSLPDGTSFISIGTTGLVGGGPGLSGTFVFGLSFVNERGYIGPPSSGVTLSLGGSQAVVYTVGWGASYLMNYYGVTAIQLYRSQVDGVVMAGTTIAAISFSGNTTLLYDKGSSLLNTALVAPSTFYMPNLGGTFLFAAPTGTKINPPFIPRFTEIYNNQLFMAGFSTAPSTFWWSQIGEPEGIQANFNTEVRTNDGDVISGMRQYLGSLLIMKRKSIHLLSGDNPNNFFLQQISDQYGCLSHKAIVPWNNVVWFLDSKGIMEYNGANLQCVSGKIESVFNNMNIQAAYDKAYGLHVKKYNEIWFAIPANGATINNQIIVYDYVAQAWTHYDGLQLKSMTNAFAGLPHLTPFAGNYTGGIVYFDSTLNSDNDQGITCSFDSMFFAARGQTTENMYRRFYLNVDPVLGFTQPITMTFKTNYGSTVQLSRTIYQNPYQSRVDFGLSARSIQASMYHYSTSLALKINGFTVESRFQRSV